MWSGDQEVGVWFGGGLFGAGWTDPVLDLAVYAKDLTGGGTSSSAECAFTVHRRAPDMGLLITNHGCVDG